MWKSGGANNCSITHHMIQTSLKPIRHLMLLSLTMCCSCLAQLSSDNFTNQLARLAQLNNLEIDLGQQLFPPTNTVGFSSFERLVFESIEADRARPHGIAFEQITMVLYCPVTNDCLESSTEMASTDRLLYSQDNIMRTNSSCKIPCNRIRVVDPAAKNFKAEVNILVAVWPLNNQHAIRHFRRSFWFEHQNSSWQRVKQSFERE